MLQSWVNLQVLQYVVLEKLWFTLAVFVHTFYATRQPQGLKFHTSILTRKLNSNLAAIHKSKSENPTDMRLTILIRSTEQFTTENWIGFDQGRFELLHITTRPKGSGPVQF